jgi:hypothetical protein
MTQTLQSPTTSEAAPASAARFIVNDKGEPLYALIDYELYLVLQETIDEWYAGQRAAAAYQEWLEDPSTARPWEEVKAEMIAEGLLDG